MPLFYQQDINDTTRLAVWQIGETEDFFDAKVSLQRSITHPHKRLQHLAGRYLLSFLFDDFPHQAIEIADTRKPFLRDERYHFSISHCGDYAAAIVSSEERVGVDIEMITPRIHNIKSKFLHADELAFVDAHEAGRQTALLTLLWSAKEALFKWWGSGEIEFSDMLRIEPFLFSGKGNIHARVIKAELDIPLLLHYRMQSTLSLAWLHSGQAV